MNKKNRTFSSIHLVGVAWIRLPLQVTMQTAWLSVICPAIHYFWLLNSTTHWNLLKVAQQELQTQYRNWLYFMSQAELHPCAPGRTQPTRRARPPAPAAPDPNRSSSHTRLCSTDPGRFPLQVIEGTTVNITSQWGDHVDMSVQKRSMTNLGLYSLQKSARPCWILSCPVCRASAL